MATSVESSSPASLNKGISSTVAVGSSPMFSPSSDKRFWSALRSRVDVLLENRKPIDDSRLNQSAVEDDRAKRKEDAALLLRGFDSVAYTLSQLSNDLDNALQGARELAGPPTLTELVHSNLVEPKSNQEQSKQREEGEEEREEGNRGVKRKQISDDDSEQDNGHNSKPELGKLKKAKNLAILMATKAATLAKEMKSIKSDLCFTQERCALLEAENRRLREMRPPAEEEEDDLVRLQMEALLAEKSRLANENANLTRENQCLHQLVEYHQMTSQDLSASYEDLVRGMCLDFSSPIDEEEEDEEALRTPRKDLVGFSTRLDECYEEEGRRRRIS